MKIPCKIPKTVQVEQDGEIVYEEQLCDALLLDVIKQRTESDGQSYEIVSGLVYDVDAKCIIVVVIDFIIIEPDVLTGLWQ